MFWKSQIKLNPVLCNAHSLYCPYSRHRYVWSKFGKQRYRKFLFDCDYDINGKNGIIDIVSFVPPLNSKALGTRQIKKEFFEHKFAKFRIRFSADITGSIDAIQNCFQKEIENAGSTYCLIDGISEPQIVTYYKSKYKRNVQYDYYIIEGEIGLTNSFLYNAYKYGFGCNKADGFGLMHFEPICIEKIIENSLDKTNKNMLVS